MSDFICERCEDTGRITVRVTYPMSYVAPGEPPDYAHGVTGSRCDQCDPVARWSGENDE
jgi:hypothetical protein